jgi:hypothetical protein
MSIRGVITGAVLMLPAVTWTLGQGTFNVRFDQPRYTVEAGGTFQVSAVIDPVPPGGLFSFGVQILFEPANVQIASTRAIVVPAPLNFNGPLGAEAVKVVSPGMAGARGSVDPIILPPQGYVGSTLVSFQLSDVSGSVGDSYQIELGLFRILGPTESVFVSGTGDRLDSNLTFGMAHVEVIPEPSVISIILCAVLIAVARGWPAILSSLKTLILPMERRTETKEDGRG